MTRREARQIYVVWPAALYHSGQAAFAQLTEEVGE